MTMSIAVGDMKPNRSSTTYAVSVYTVRYTLLDRGGICSREAYPLSDSDVSALGANLGPIHVRWPHS